MKQSRSNSAAIKGKRTEVDQVEEMFSPRIEREMRAVKVHEILVGTSDQGIAQTDIDRVPPTRQERSANEDTIELASAALYAPRYITDDFDTIDSTAPSHPTPPPDNPIQSVVPPSMGDILSTQPQPEVLREDGAVRVALTVKDRSRAEAIVDVKVDEPVAEFKTSKSN